MTAPVVCFSRKRNAWVIYDRPNRRDAVAHAESTMGTYRDRYEGEQKGCLPMVWAGRAEQFATKRDAEMTGRQPPRAAYTVRFESDQQRQDFYRAAGASIVAGARA